MAGQERVGGLGSDRQDAFGRLTDRDLAASYRLAALILGNEIEAQDATQDATLIAWQHYASLREPERFGPWFQRILVNVCRDRLRSRRRVRFLTIDEAPEQAVAEAGSGLAARDALRRSLIGLSPDHRTVVVLRYFAGLSLEEIAERTGERLGTVKSRLHYALEALRAAYDAADRLPGGTGQ